MVRKSRGLAEPDGGLDGSHLPEIVASGAHVVFHLLGEWELEDGSCELEHEFAVDGVVE